MENLTIANEKSSRATGSLVSLRIEMSSTKFLVLLQAAWLFGYFIIGSGNITKCFKRPQARIFSP